MKKGINVGDQVKLIGVPDWLVHDLPEDEKKEIISCIGETAIVTDIDKLGYFWLGFGSTVQDANFACYSGHSFCVSSEYLQLTGG